MLEPISPTRWDAAAARHLLLRAGFSAPPAQVSALAAMAPGEAVDGLLNFPAEAVAPPDFVPYPLRNQEVGFLLRGVSQEQRRDWYRDHFGQERRAVADLKAWWIDRILDGPSPLQEKLALFWHGHFATSAQKVLRCWHNFELNALFRRRAAGNFKALALEVAKSPAMLRYLDNDRNVAGQPNENWARELLELFTLGKGHYAEADIKEAARAFTGWSTDGAYFVYRDRLHDGGEKTFLGRTGPFGGEDIIDIIFEQPAASEHLARKLWRYFVHPQPDDAGVKQLAAHLRDSGYELRPALRTLFLSQAFYAPANRAACIKSPIQWLAALYEDLRLTARPHRVLVNVLRSLGQDVFFPPDVSGWEGGRAWLNANTLLTRYNMPPYLANLSRKRAGWRAAEAFQGLTFGTPAECVDALARRSLAAPLAEGQRKLLAETLCPDRAPGDSLQPDELREGPMAATLHLMTSMAEYQLC
jgi:uncharacterized protein (DUF1800 family)